MEQIGLLLLTPSSMGRASAHCQHYWAQPRSTAFLYPDTRRSCLTRRNQKGRHFFYDASFIWQLWPFLFSAPIVAGHAAKRGQWDDEVTEVVRVDFFSFRLTLRVSAASETVSVFVVSSTSAAAGCTLGCRACCCHFWRCACYRA